MKGKMIPPIPEMYRKRIEELTLADDIGFMRGFDGNIEGTEHLVRTLTGRDDITVISVQAQKHLSSIDRHSVILDIYAEGRNGEQIDIEMQRFRGSRAELGARAERYGALLVLHSLDKGESYSHAGEVMVIFITDTDAFGEGRAVYDFRARDRTGAPMPGGRESFIVANGSYRDTMESELSRLLSDLSEKDLGRMRSPMMRAALYRVKGDEMMLRDTYGMLYRIETENLEKGMEKGRKEGSAERQRQIAMKMLRKKSYAISEVAELTELPIKEVERLAGSIKQP